MPDVALIPGTIVWADLDPVQGREQGGRRPMLVVSSDIHLELVTRTVFPTVPAQVTYELTALGGSLMHLVKQLADWSLDHRETIGLSRADCDTQHPDNEIH